MHACSVAQLFLTLYDPVDYSPPGSSVHWISQARILEWVAISFSRGIFLTQGLNRHLLHWQVGSLPLSHLEAHPRYIVVIPRERVLIWRILSQDDRNFSSVSMDGRNVKILRTGDFYLRIVSLVKPSIKCQWRTKAMSDLQVSKSYLSHPLFHKKLENVLHQNEVINKE